MTISISFTCEVEDLPVIREFFGPGDNRVAVRNFVTQPQHKAENLVDADVVEVVADDDIHLDQQAQIQVLCEQGKTPTEIKVILGLEDARAVTGIYRHVAAERKRAEVLKLRSEGVGAAKAGHVAGLERGVACKIYKEAGKAEVAAVKESLRESFTPAILTRRILQMADQKITAKSISDSLEEDYGMVISPTEIMDIITKNSKGMI